MLIIKLLNWLMVIWIVVVGIGNEYSVKNGDLNG